MKDEKDKEEARIDEKQKSIFNTVIKRTEDIDDYIFAEEGYRCSER